MEVIAVSPFLARGDKTIDLRDVANQLATETPFNAQDIKDLINVDGPTALDVLAALHTFAHITHNVGSRKREPVNKPWLFVRACQPEELVQVARKKDYGTGLGKTIIPKDDTQKFLATNQDYELYARFILTANA